MNQEPRIGPESLPEALQVTSSRASLAPEEAQSPGFFLAGRNLKEAMVEAERLLILQALEENGGSRKATALQLGINRTTLFNKMTKLGLMERQFNSSSQDDTQASHP